MELDTRPNSDRSKAQAERPKATKITTGQVKKVSQTESKISKIGDSMVKNMIVPSLQDLVTEIFQTGVDIFMETIKCYIYGDSTKVPRKSTTTTTVNYSKISRTGGTRKTTTTTERPNYHRARKTFENALLETRLDAERVKEQMLEYATRYDFVSIADFYGFVEIDPQWTDEKWGWYPDDVQNADIRRIRGGWMIDLPDPDPLD